MNSKLATTALLVQALNLSAAAPVQAAEPLCLKLEAAASKTLTTPFHLYVTEKRAFAPGLAKGAAMIGIGKTETSEEISTGKEVYVAIHGKWRKSPVNLVALHKGNSNDPETKKMREAEKCVALPNEAVDGEPASVYRIENPSLGIVTKIWISKTRQLPLKAETANDIGSTKFNTSMRYDYKTVSAPDGVQ